MKSTLLYTTYNRDWLLFNSLQRLQNLTLPDEVLIVDDGSTDKTRQLLQEFEGKLPIKYIYNNNPEWSICSMARNIGVKNAIGDIIITSEPELIFVTDIVKQMLEDNKQFPNQIISAGVVYHAQQNAGYNPGFANNPAEALKGEIVEDYQTEPRPYHPSGYCKTKNMQATFTALYEKKWLMEVGGWDEEFPGAWGWDDIDLCTRLRINGINQHICPEMEVIHQWHPHPPGDVWSTGSQANELHMKEKRLDEVEKDILEKKRLKEYKHIDERLVANKGREWGVTRA